MLGGLGSSSLQEEPIYLLSPNLHFIKVLQIMIKHLWKTKRLWNQVVSFSVQNPSNMCEGWE
jgi:hypothetical protein